MFFLYVLNYFNVSRETLKCKCIRYTIRTSL